MEKTWNEIRDAWLRKTSLTEEAASWAIESINKSEEDIYEIQKIAKKDSFTELDEKLRLLKKSIKSHILEKENSLDDLTLNTTNSAKLQVSVPSSLNYLMKAWAAAEGRDLSSVALQCLEIGLRTMKSKGSIPSAALERYDVACKKRIALAEVNNIWEEYEGLTVKSSSS
ncbi:MULTISPECIES: hypothetical protein [Prochlorococcus]|uniref:VHS domain-containing protein n=1 Tax=Prochlorococcus marinus (strain SARG / CCMP1375 / SS120) TaxID=167539 RepID=Q7VCC8_PROMA|nr:MULTISPECIES: hypothetical protein [Prochlorococcus]AAP99856.1 Predicted protein [Prochlorococcus marinus subsp. marinus str. CCMP1375]KGG11797.1 putative VHS domain [Prochlorococcus marinus str. LG]KGG18789.1 putative VHS domain [Prochlorococcus marinus str. SS2]KGG23673.1 putative VHS domain [Prochlorococcus marinus str. SS35]KGG32091.1 putative VHS domain [Prochlorococcus marinus str. SS51]